MSESVTREKVPRRWWQARRVVASCGCGWRSKPQPMDSLGELKLTMAEVNHRVQTGYSCGS